MEMSFRVKTVISSPRACGSRPRLVPIDLHPRDRLHVGLLGFLRWGIGLREDFKAREELLGTVEFCVGCSCIVVQFEGGKGESFVVGGIEWGRGEEVVTLSRLLSWVLV